MAAIVAVAAVSRGEREARTGPRVHDGQRHRDTGRRRGSRCAARSCSAARRHVAREWRSVPCSPTSTPACLPSRSSASRSATRSRRWPGPGSCERVARFRSRPTARSGRARARRVRPPASARSSARRIGVSSLPDRRRRSPGGDVPSVWRTWWLGDMGGDLDRGAGAARRGSRTAPATSACRGGRLEAVVLWPSWSSASAASRLHAARRPIAYLVFPLFDLGGPALLAARERVGSVPRGRRDRRDVDRERPRARSP